MFKLRNFTILCSKWAHFQFDACYRSLNSWDGGMFTMVKHLLFFSKQFEDVWASRLWVSGVLFWNLVPFLPDKGFQLLKSLWSSLMYFSFNDAGRPIQHPDSSATKPCCCNSCSMWFCIVLLNWMLMTRWKVSLLFSPEDTASVISNKNVKFGLVWP